MAAPRPAGAALTGLTALALAMVACTREPDAALALQQRCVCEYVTDFDAPGRTEVRVCAPAFDREGVARSCAISSGVGAVTTCVCQATPQSCAGEPPCKLPSDAPPAPPTGSAL